MEIKLPLTTGQFIGLQIYDQDNDVIAVGSTPECATFIRDRVNAYDRLVSALRKAQPYVKFYRDDMCAEEEAERMALLAEIESIAPPTNTEAEA